MPPVYAVKKHKTIFLFLKSILSATLIIYIYNVSTSW